MSEYQYYEFRAIDRPLNTEQKEKVSSLSSRASVTSHQASFVYNYGDFRGNVKQLMTNYFDVMMYMANWGSRRLMFRIPSSLIDMKQIRAFFAFEEIDHWSSKDKKSIILDLNFQDEDQADWTEGEGWLDELIDLREELIQGDFRVLYLAWLKAAKDALEIGEMEKDTLEPPVPCQLKQLSSAQKAYVKFLDIDEAMISVAAEQSNNKQEETVKPEVWIKKLSDKKKQDFLIRLSREEKNLSVLLNRYLHDMAVKKQSQIDKTLNKRRSISTLIELAQTWRQKKKSSEKKIKKRKEANEIC